VAPARAVAAEGSLAPDAGREAMAPGASGRRAMRSPVFWIVVAGGLVVAAVEVVLVQELILFARGKPPVTTVLRTMVETHHPAALCASHAVAFGLGFGVAHIVADASLG
jgi:hypothetical protein